MVRSCMTTRTAVWKRPRGLKPSSRVSTMDLVCSLLEPRPRPRDLERMRRRPDRGRARSSCRAALRACTSALVSSTSDDVSAMCLRADSSAGVSSGGWAS